MPRLSCKGLMDPPKISQESQITTVRFLMGGLGERDA
jgi:hypothetical protein